MIIYFHVSATQRMGILTATETPVELTTESNTCQLGDDERREGSILMYVRTLRVDD